MSDITDAGPRLRAMNDALAEIERLRITDAEREAVDTAEASLMRESTDLTTPQPVRHRLGAAAATLRGLLERTREPLHTPGVCSVPERGTPAEKPPADPERDIPPAWLARPYWVDPPSGWLYGFPRLYDPATDGEMTAWMIAHGYPERLARQGLPCTFTQAGDGETV